MLVVGGGVHAGHEREEALEIGGGAVIVGGVHPIDRLEVAVVPDLAFTGGRQDDEFVAEITADRAGFGDHGNCLQPHALKRAHIGQHHLAVADDSPGVIEVDAVGVFHEEFASAHDAEAGPHLVTELPLDVVEDLREFAVAAHGLAGEIGDHLLIGGTEQHVAVVAIPDAQHLLAVVLVAAAFAPQLRGLDRRHQHFLRARRVLLFPHDAFDVLQHAKAERQPGVDSGRGLPHQAGAQHQAMRRDLRFRRGLLQRGDQAMREAHSTIVQVTGGADPTGRPVGCQSGRSGTRPRYFFSPHDQVRQENHGISHFYDRNHVTKRCRACSGPRGRTRSDTAAQV